jgi:hypothetical protein
MTTSKQEKIDTLISTIQQYVDIRYQINKETDLCNHSYVVKNLNPIQEKIVSRLKDSINDLTQ